MLPIYQAIEKVKTPEISLPGGSTKPWQIVVKTDNGPKSYVVKLFKTKDIEQIMSVSREVFGSVLASQLDLQCPSPALIEFGQEFLDRLNEEELYDLIDRDKRIKFGCEFIEGSNQFTPNISTGILERYDIEDIYAFDNLISNVDRRVAKPNILLFNKEYYLIDHELSLPINYNNISHFRNGKSTFPFTEHIFYRTLKNRKKVNKEAMFETFQDRLRYFNPGVLIPYKNQLLDLEHPVGNFDDILMYLTEIKNNSPKFISILKQQVG